MTEVRTTEVRTTEVCPVFLHRGGREEAMFSQDRWDCEQKGYTFSAVFLSIIVALKQPLTN